MGNSRHRNFPFRPSRRRFIAIAGAAAALGPQKPVSAAAIDIMAGQNAQRWTGQALGADVSITLAHIAGSEAKHVVSLCRGELKRLEAVFNLFDPDSALSRLNREGRLDPAPAELVELLSLAKVFHRHSGGAFAVTVQPLWQLYADHFRRNPRSSDGPDWKEIARVMPLIDDEAIDVSHSRVALGRDGMAITLNGIAQGFITDRITGLLRANGIDNMLVNIGEYRAVGRHPEERPWRIGIADAHAPWRAFDTVDLTDRAVATSGGYGTPFDETGRHHHLFDPKTGLSNNDYLSVSVIADRAATADALSTAIAVSPPDRAPGILTPFGGTSAILRIADGSIRRLQA